MAKATSKPVQVDYFPMTTWQEMAQALNQVEPLGYYGVLSNQKDGGWRLDLTGPNQARLACQLGQVLVWNKVVLSACAATDFQQNYTTS
jgi:hypothetical protein